MNDEYPYIKETMKMLSFCEGDKCVCKNEELMKRMKEELIPKARHLKNGDATIRFKRVTNKKE